jgi:glycosyltransferase involved in cell wall biosynthesis
MKVGFLSFRLGGADGASRAASSLAQLFEATGAQSVFIAGEGPVDRLVPGLSGRDGQPCNQRALESALDDIDLVVAENILTIPLNKEVSRCVNHVLRGRRVIVRHFDPPWQRTGAEYADHLPVDDPSFLHIAVCQLTQEQLRARGVEAELFYPAFERPLPDAKRCDTRRALSIAPDEVLCLHPVRAIARKNIEGAVAIAERIGAIYWLTGAAEQGYQVTARAILDRSAVRTIWRSLKTTRMDDAYAAADIVLFPSEWEGFGLPPIEAAFRNRISVVGHYPVAEELRELGFSWPGPQESRWITRLLVDTDERQRTIDRNRELAEEHFGWEITKQRLVSTLMRRGWIGETGERK